MSDVISFIVFGKAEPRGSKINVPLYDEIIGADGQPLINPKTCKPYLTPRLNANFRPMSFMRDDNSASGPWMKKVAKAARQVMVDRPPLRGPLKLFIRFYLDRPMSHYGTGRNANVLKDRYEHARPIVRPDRLKLARAVEDALTGVVYVDDAQTIGGSVEKFYCGPGERPRVEIEVHLPQVRQPAPQQRSLIEQ